MSRLVFAALAAAAALTACYQDDSSGPQNRKPLATVLLTDAPFPFDTVQSVDVYVISISASTQPDTGSSADSMSWVTITEPHRQINLLALQQGALAELGTGEIPAAQYRAIRVVIDGDSSEIRFADGTPALVHWGGSGRQAIHAFVEAAVDVPAAQEETEIVIDFDVGRSFHYNDLGDGGFNFLPWIRAVNRAATGSIAGNVRGDTASGSNPIAHATVSAWGGGPGNWNIYSTGTTDGAGHYRLAYLLPGTYIVGVDPPTGSPLGASLDSNVAVARGVETQHPVTLSQFAGSLFILGASSMIVGDTNQLEAIVVDAQHEQDTNAVVTWENLNNAVLGLTPNGRLALVNAKIGGTGRIVATSGSFADTLLIVVAPDSSQAAARK
jgi:hypothetical protein